MASPGRRAGGGGAAGYLPVLDGVRAVSILLVVGSHLGLGRVIPGAFGVTLFFFLSGYLITRQLLATLRDRGTIDFGRFYARRAARLMPAAMVYVAVAGGLFCAIGGRITPAGWIAALFYGANYFDLLQHYHSVLTGVRHPFNVLWSLAIEEHFYAIWPLVLLLIGRWRWAVTAVWALCAAALAWRLWLLGHCFGGAGGWVCGPINPNPLWRYNRLYLATDTRFDSILYGAAMALAEARSGAARGHWAGGALLLATSFALPGAAGRFAWRPSVQGVALGLLMPALLSRESVVKRALCAPAALYVGRLSYSLYLWHAGALMLADYAVPGGGLAWLAVALAGSAGGAMLSYHAVEQPMLRLRRQLGSHAPDETMPVFAQAIRETRAGWGFIRREADGLPGAANSHATPSRNSLFHRQ